MRKNKLVDIILFPLSFFTGLVMLSSNAYAFGKLINGFNTVTDTYLIPLATAVSGATFVLFCILSYFKQEEYSKKVGHICIMTILTMTGVEIIKQISQSFS